MREKPLMVVYIEGLDIMVIGSVHSLFRIVPAILYEIEKFKPDFIGIEITDKSQETAAFEIESVRKKYYSRLVCIDRQADITDSRYYSGMEPKKFFREAFKKYLFLPFNMASNFLYNYFPGLYSLFSGGDFFSFGWSEEDTRRYIFERDEYMAATLIKFIKSRRDDGFKCERYLILTGRRHVNGIVSILEAYRDTGDYGSYYAGGKVLDVFSVQELDKRFTLGRPISERNYINNRFIDSTMSSIFLPLYSIFIFMVSLLALLSIVAILWAIISIF
jgi:hypothetical protein